jgi:hypothetical protein
MARLRLPALTLAAYLVLASAAWLHAAVAGEQDWSAFRIAFFAVWLLGAIGLVLRRRVGLGVVLLIEVLSLVGWIGRPGDWDLFAVQLALVLLLLSPPLDEWAPSRPSDLPRESTRWPVALICLGVLAWAAVAATTAAANAIPILAFVPPLLVLQWRVERARAADRLVR